MTINSESSNTESLEERMVAKAVENSAYRQRLLSNPKAVLEEELGSELPQDVSFEVLQQSPQQIYLVLPIDIDEIIRDGMLSHEELETIAGGSISAISKLTANVSVFASIDYVSRKAWDKWKSKK
ncbi:NHLP leader peptide family RiPP precursor [Nostoc sp. CMAA1605]|uniref:NHLP leader peptide family RiPP precursor n=1 Tax=Nostoc sp. CMAA1605 TaxID=2055159 RepID=UPI001F322981|nr:NHLP leader peptide family RiPP precursor [Nostoc sp. CMAA1605]MCF4965704.1 NHLP leader peptide family natural product precursor [Nostoc sp. CMAA1605]